MKTNATDPAGLTLGGVVLEKETRRPIAGATVTLQRMTASPVNKWSDLVPPQDLVTDAAGRFSFDVSADHAALPGFCMATRVRADRHAAREWQGAGLGHVLSAIESGRRPWFDELFLAPSDEVSGVVEGPDGRPLAGCEVSHTSIAGPAERAGLAAGSDRTSGVVTTDAAGRFAFNAIRGAAVAGFTAQADAFAPQHRDLGATRGDVGIVRLATGRRLRGRVVDDAGGGVAGLTIRVEPNVPDVHCGHLIWRVTTDGDGRFVTPAAPPGPCRVDVRDARFMTRTVDMPVEADPAAIEFRPADLVTVAGTVTDSAGQPASLDPTVFLVGRLGPEWYHTEPVATTDGRFELRVPRGLERVELQIMQSPGHAMLWRRGDAGDWRAGDDLRLETLAGDVTDLYVVVFKSPVVTIRATDAAGQPVAIRPTARYVGPILRKRDGRRWISGIEGDCDFAGQPDGSWRSTFGLLPGHAIDVTAAGGAWTTHTLTLEEGQTREIILSPTVGH